MAQTLRIPRSDNRLPLILDEAARLFREKGYAATSMRDIAAAVDMLPGSLYYHFAAKEDLLVAVYEEGVPELADLIERHAQACASQRLSHGGRVRRLLAASAADWVKRRIESLDTAEFEQLCALVQRGELDYASADLRAVELALHAEKKT